MNPYTLSALFLITFKISKAVEIFVHANVLEYGLWYNSDYFYDFTTTIRRLEVDKRFTNAFGGQFKLHREIPCDAVVEIKIEIFVQKQYTLFHETSAYVNTLLNKFKNTTLGQGMESLKTCSHGARENCPFSPGLYVMNDCFLNTAFVSNWGAKNWNLTFRLFTPDEVEMGRLWVTMELDDTKRNQAKRPSTSQMRRRKDWRNTTKLI